MPSTLTLHANEKSTYVVTAAFTDESGAAVTPKSIVWTLATRSGTIVNDRDKIEVAVPASSIDILLSAQDLALRSSEKGKVRRILTVEAVYDSSLGEDLPLKDQVVFSIEDLKSVT